VQSLKACKVAEEEFGTTVNGKGFKLLNNVRVIYGDGISSPEVIREILANLAKHGYSADNMAFGMGGGLLQKCDRDTMKFAMKCSAIIADGKFIPVFKEPITDPGKRSKRGFLDLIKENGEYKTIEKDTCEPLPNSELITVFENGEMLVEYTLDEIRKRAK